MLIQTSDLKLKWQRKRRGQVFHFDIYQNERPDPNNLFYQNERPDPNKTPIIYFF